MYKVLGSDQKEYGPVSEDTLRVWIREGRANAQTQAKLEGAASWRFLSEMPEFREALAAGRTPPAMPGLATPGVPGVALQGPIKTSGLAVASLVLGILGLCSFGISSIVGCILGIVALIKIEKSKGQLAGKGLAIGGICCTALIFVMLPVMLGLMLPALTKAKAKAQSVSCLSNLKQIGLAARMYASEHNEQFPPDFAAMRNELPSPNVLICPLDRESMDMTQLTWANLAGEEISYEFVLPGIGGAEASSQVVFRCRNHGHVGYGDGSAHQNASSRNLGRD